jgi:hypothetical protein
MFASWKCVWMPAADVLLHPLRTGRNRHLAIGAIHGRLGHRGAREIRLAHLLDDVHLVRVDGDRDLVRPRLQLGEHVASVIRQPLGDFTFCLRGEGDRAADLQDQLRNAGADAREQLVEFRQALGALAVLFAYVDVHDSGAGVVAVDCLLDLRRHRYWDVLREVRGHPFRAVRRRGDDQFLLVFGEQRAVEKIHCRSLSVGNVKRNPAALRRARRPRFRRAPSCGGRARSP